LLSTVQFQQRNHEAVRLVQDALLLREENKRRYGFKTSQGIYAIGRVVLNLGQAPKSQLPVIPFIRMWTTGGKTTLLIMAEYLVPVGNHNATTVHNGTRSLGVRKWRNQMNSQNSNSQMHGNCRWSMFGCLVAGLGIGAIVGLVLAPQSGEDTRDLISSKCTDGMDTVKGTVEETGQRLADMLGRGQQQVSEAVDAGREAFRKAKAGAGL
jgi:gas vesicle protein